MILENTVGINQVLINVSGKIYVEEAVQLRDHITRFIEQGHNTFVIDLGGVDYIDSTGLGTLVAINKQARNRGGSVIVKGLQGLAKELFKLTRLDKVFEVQ